ncbi:MAG: hybrid sensor histidine kinase/response regulator [Spirulina sp. DLM2.Bin59]|nr:MAG: hybrid sensor histidine kinase/response regulator [Spirulina sp. DLM2.Bin59]
MAADLLIVDDTPANLRLLSEMLQTQGYGVRKAINGTMALKAVRSLPPDLILLDINLPDLDGYQVCEQLKQEPAFKPIPVIFLSALSEVEDKIKAFSSGGADYITKPFVVEEVLARVEHHLELAQLHQELTAKNRDLETALVQLKKTQAQMIQQEKMAGLSQLVAGLAHEINNPVGFIAGNLSPALDYTHILLDVISRYQAELPQPSPELQAFLDDVELDFVRTDLPHLMQSMHKGTERLKSLLLALRIFAHLDESEVKQVDVHKSLDNTLRLLDHRLTPAPAITILKEYADLPHLTCYGRKLNQVFLHLLNNAIDALRQRRDPAVELKIAIKTSAIEDYCWIEISDNGVGIAPEVRSQLFDPFYTTKPIGQGQGLGLATSYQIVVEDHHGVLDFTSEPGVGTTFKMGIPMNLLRDS